MNQFSLFILALVVPAAGQTFHVLPAPESAIELISLPSRASLNKFSTLLSASRSTATNDWLPYSVVLTNRTSHALAAATFEWSLNDNAGKVTSTIDLIGNRLTNPRGRFSQDRG